MNTVFKILAKFSVLRADLFPSGSNRSWYTQTIRCPESGQPARITVDVLPGTVAGRRRNPVTVKDCTLWSTKKECIQSCIKGRHPF